MLALILQTLLLVLLAFFLGWLLGRLMKSFFCKHSIQQQSSIINAHQRHTRSSATPTSPFDRKSPFAERAPETSNMTHIAKRAAAVTGATAATKLASDALARHHAEKRLTDSEIDINLPEADTSIDLPDVEIPTVDTEVNIDLPNLDTSIELPDDSIVGIELPDVDASLELPEVNIEGTELPDMEIGDIEIPTVDTDVNIDLPNLDTSIELPEVNASVDLPDSDSLSGTLKGVALAAAGTIAATSLTNNDDKDTDVTLEQPESGIENMELSDVDTSIELANADINGDQLSDLETSNAEQLAVDATNPLDKGIESSEANFEDMSTEADDSELTTDTEPAEQAEFVLDSDPSPSDNDDAQAPDSDDVSLTGSIATAAAAATAGAATLAASKITSTSDDANNEPSSTGQASSIEGLYSDNLQVFEGIGPKMEEILKSHHINTWDDLSQQSELGIRNTLGTYGDQYQGVENVDSWITQAKLASNGELRELIERQKEDGISKIERLFGSSALEQASNATSDQQSIEAASNNADNATSTADAESTSSLEATSAVSSLSTLAAFQNIRSIDSINDEMSELNLMAGEVLELNHQEYGKLGPLHCGVTLHGFISVVGDVATVEDKQTLFFSRNNISVHRDEDTFTFIKWLKETS